MSNALFSQWLSGLDFEHWSDLHAQGFKNVRIMPGGYASLFPELMPGKVRAARQRRAQGEDPR
jgi:hypothetical protein